MGGEGGLGVVFECWVAVDFGFCGGGGGDADVGEEEEFALCFVEVIGGFGYAVGVAVLSAPEALGGE